MPLVSLLNYYNQAMYGLIHFTVKLVSARWSTKYVMVTPFLNDVRHIFENFCAAADINAGTDISTNIKQYLRAN